MSEPVDITGAIIREGDRIAVAAVDREGKPHLLVRRVEEIAHGFIRVPEVDGWSELFPADIARHRALRLR